LEACLVDEMGHEPKLFLDSRMEVGTYWPDELANALLKSRYLVAVWSPPYFTSRWCVAEWKSMCARERVLGIPGPANTRGLIYPIVFSDGDLFPTEAHAVQSQHNLSQYAFPYEQFRRTEAYLEFHDKVKAIAADLAQRLESAPTWDETWPIWRPDAFENPPPKFPRLG
jgi:hypothetical protein